MANPFLDSSVAAQKNPFLDDTPSASKEPPKDQSFVSKALANTVEALKDTATATGEAMSEPASGKNVPYGLQTADMVMRGLGKVGNAVGSPVGAAQALIQGPMTTVVEPYIPAEARAIKSLVPNDPRFNEFLTQQQVHNLAKGQGADLANVALMKAGAAKGEMPGLGVVGNAATKAREALNNASDKMAKNVPVTKENAYIIKALKKAGHSDEEIVDITKRAKEQGMTVGEASNNPEILGMERKISGLNKPGGQTVRDFVKTRVDPKNNVSMPFKLKSIADPLSKEVDRASKQIGAIVETAPKTPVNMNGVKSSLLSEKRPPGSAVTNTLNRIDGLVEWAKEQGNTFEAWHRVKQDIYAIGKEASDPNAIMKLDKKTVTQYYNKVNDVLSGRASGLPQDLAQTGANYARENNAFHQNLSGRTIQEVLKTMPTGGTPAQALKHLYNKLAGNAELQEELFENMPAAQRKGMMEFLKAVKDAGRSGVNDTVKSMQEGSPSFPISTRQVLHKAYDKIADFLTKKDYDALGKALTSPEVEQIAKKLGYIKPQPPEKPILRLTYQPKPPEIAVGREGTAKIVGESEQKSINQARERMEKLGLTSDVLRAQDLNAIREMETKYGQSELGKFVVANKNEPIMGRAWEIPQTEYSQAQVDRMMRNSAWDKLTRESKDKINAEIRTAWDSHQVTVADMILAARQAAKELAVAKGEKLETTSIGHAFLNALNPNEIKSSLATPVDQFINQP